MNRPPVVQWIDPKWGAKEATALALQRVAADGAAVLRGHGNGGRRVLAAVAANLPDELEALRVPQPSDKTVTTLVVYPAGTPAPFFYDA